jgi:hypothetical protein
LKRLDSKSCRQKRERAVTADPHKDSVYVEGDAVGRNCEVRRDRGEITCVVNVFSIGNPVKKF